MRYAMLTYSGPKRIEAWRAMSEADREADVQDHVAWFQEHGERISGGLELAYPRQAARLRRWREKPLMTDGPFAETKEVLGGIIFLEAASFDEAIEIASTWPSLKHEDVMVEVVPEQER